MKSRLKRNIDGQASTWQLSFKDNDRLFLMMIGREINREEAIGHFYSLSDEEKVQTLDSWERSWQLFVKQTLADLQIVN